MRLQRQYFRKDVAIEAAIGGDTGDRMHFYGRKSSRLQYKAKKIICLCKSSWDKWRLLFYAWCALMLNNWDFILLFDKQVKILFSLLDLTNDKTTAKEWLGNEHAMVGISIKSLCHEVYQLKALLLCYNKIKQLF